MVNILDWKYEALARKDIIIEHLRNKIFDLEKTADDEGVKKSYG